MDICRDARLCGCLLRGGLVGRVNSFDEYEGEERRGGIGGLGDVMGWDGMGWPLMSCIRACTDIVLFWGLGGWAVGMAGFTVLGGSVRSCAELGPPGGGRGGGMGMGDC